MRMLEYNESRSCLSRRSQAKAGSSLNHLLATPKLEETRISEGGSRRLVASKLS